MSRKYNNTTDILAIFDLDPDILPDRVELKKRLDKSRELVEALVEIASETESKVKGLKYFNIVLTFVSVVLFVLYSFQIGAQ